MKHQRTTRAFLSILSLLILIAALAGGCGTPEDQAPPTVQEREGRPLVKVAPVVRTDLSPQIEATGTLVATRHARLAALVGGRIDTLGVDIGQRVRAGELLFKVREVDYRLALSRAEANLSQVEALLREAERERLRADNLFRGGSATEQMRDQAMSAQERAQAAVSLAQAARDQAHCSIHAPYDGVVTQRFLEEQESVAPGTPVLEVMDLTVLVAEIELPERTSLSIGDDTRVSLTTAFAPAPLPGRIVAVNERIDPSNRTFLVKVAVDNQDFALKAGLFVTAHFSLPKVSGMLAVPGGALIRDEGLSAVWVVDGEGIAHRRVVQEKGLSGEMVWISAGLTEGEQVVVSGGGRLFEGAAVKVAP